MKRLIIIDNDGGVDDAWAIFALLKDQRFEVLALTCVFGNTDVDNVCDNNLRLVTQLNRTEIPVCRGAGSPLQPNGSPIQDGFQYFHGRNGFGDVPLEPLSNIPSLSPDSAVSKLNELVTKHQEEITLVCLGPLTNIALAIRDFPEFGRNVKAAYIMGGNYTAMGNSSKRPEFNVHLDPEAADVVLRGLGAKCTLLPWETCRSTNISLKWKERLRDNCGPSMEFLHKIEAPLTAKKIKMGLESYVSSDLLLAVILSREEQSVKEFVSHSLGVELDGKYTRGQLVVLDHLNDSNEMKVKIIQNVCSKQYMDLLESFKHL